MVSSTGRPTLLVSASTRAERTSRSRRVIDDDRIRRGPATLAAAADHAQLEGQQLVEGQPSKGRVAVLQAGRKVDLVDRPADRLEALGRDQAGRQVFRVEQAGPVEGRPDPFANPGRGEARRQPIDGHDPAGVERVRAVLGRELGVVEDRAEAALLEPPAHDKMLSGADPALDEPPPEPGCLGLTAVVGEDGPGDLDPPPPGLLDRDRSDHDPDAGRGALGQVTQLGDRVHRPPVLVAARQVEQQVADGVQVQPATCPAQRSRPGQAAVAEGRGQQDDRIGRRRWGSPGGSRAGRGGWSAGRRSVAHRLFRRDQVPVVGLPAVADLDLEVGPRSADLTGRSPPPRPGRPPRRRTG